MKFLSNTKVIAGVVALILLGIISYIFVSLNEDGKYNNYSNIVSETDDNEQGKIPEVNVPEGWKTYTGNENKWKRGDVRITFAYPSEWTVNEAISDQKLTEVTVVGDSYSFRIDQAGRGMPRPYDYTQVIGGYNARVWNEITDSGRQFTFGITDINFIIHITASNDGEEIIDQILSSVVFYK